MVSFDDSVFSVTSNGYVTFTGGGSGAVDSNSGDDAIAVMPNGAGNFNWSGEVVTNATHAKPVYFKDSTTANTIDCDVQVGAAITGAPSDKLDAGLVSFDNTSFNVSQHGYVTFTGAGGGTVTSVLGTLNRITSSGGNDPVIDIDAGYVGQASLTTLGTVTTGTWNGTVVDEVYGGTGQSSFTTGDVLYASGANTLSKLGIGSNGEVLTIAAGVPSWATTTSGTVTSVSGTLNRITSTGGATPVIDIDSGYVGQSSITTLGTVTTGTWNGTVIDEVYGGTGNSSYVAGDILYASATNTLTKLAKGTDGQVLTLSGGVPTWAAASSGAGWVLISTQTASSSSTLEFTSGINSTYDNYVFVISSLVCSVDSIQIYMRTSTNAGVSFDAGASDYKFGWKYWGSNGSTEYAGSSTTSYIAVSGAGASNGATGNASGENLNSTIYLYGPSETTKTVVGIRSNYINDNNKPINYASSGYRDSAADVDAVRFFPSTGNFTSGTISLYGISI